MNKLKYIVEDNNDFAIFPQYFDFKEVATLMAKRGFDPVGAGNILIDDGKVYCYGHADSINISSRGEVDNYIISKGLDVLADELNGFRKASEQVAKILKDA